MEKPCKSVSERLGIALANIKEALPGLELYENYPMKERSSFKTGGPVRALALPSETSSLAKLCGLLKEQNLAPFVLGNCTNVIFPDEGTAGLFVLGMEKLQKIFLLPDGAVYAEAGVPLAKLAAFALQNELKGLEFASGIPGSVGGGTVMNAGAYGEELKDIIESVVVYSLPDQTLYEIKGEDCKFSYRKSVFQEIGGCVVLSVVFRLEKGSAAGISAKMRELNERRRDKQPLELPSAGSAFKRPEGQFAAKLIAEAGLKGYSVGGAQVSEKHSGFIVNTGSATSKDIYELMLHVRNEVYRQTKIQLEPEIILLPPDYALEDLTPVFTRNRITGGMTGMDEADLGEG